MLKFEYILIIPGINNLRKLLDNWKQQLQITKLISEQQMKQEYTCSVSLRRPRRRVSSNPLCWKVAFKATEKKEQEYYEAQESQ